MKRLWLVTLCTIGLLPTVTAAPEVEVSGLIDVYLAYNFNNPPASAGNQNVVRAFDIRSAMLDVSLLQVNLTSKPEPVGFTVTLTAGRTADLVHYNPGEDRVKLFQQAYLSTVVGNWQVDVGKFVTALGAEVIESLPNDNYSRSLPFLYAIPLYHAGIRASTSIGNGWGAQVMLVNSWDTTSDNNDKKTFHLGFSYSSDNWTFVQNLITGDETAAPPRGARTVYGTVLFYKTGADKFGLNFDFGEDKAADAKWTGYALYYRRALSETSAVALRYSFFDDKDGFRTGTAQRLSEFTLTYEYALGSATSRIELRFDRSNKPFFLDESGNATKKDQVTLTYAQVFKF